MGVSIFGQSSLDIAQQPLSRNYVINGNFDIWQRGASFSGAGFTADRWFNHANDNVSRQNFTLASPEIPSAKHFLRFSPNQIGGYHTIQYNIENGGELLSGKTVTLSFWARSNTSNSYVISVFTALFGDQQLINPNVPISLTPSWQKYTATFVIPITNSSSVHRYIRWHTNVSDNSRGFDLAQVQLEDGPVATPFRTNANSIQGELAACQRYYQRMVAASSNGNLGGFGWSTGSTSMNNFIETRTTLRAIPSSIDWGGSLQIQQTNNNTFSVSNIILNSGESSTNKVALAITHASATANLTGSFRAANDANAFIGFSAEIF